jgi:hypothetical protein
MVAQPPIPAAQGTLHKGHPTSVAFFDEAGAISEDRFFVVGLLRVEDHPSLLKEVKQLRKQHRYRQEFKWAGVTGNNFAAACDLLDLLIDSEAQYSCFVADRHVADPVARFDGTFRAYEKLATQLLVGSIQPFELTNVIADNYSAPNTRCFENTVKKECNDRLDRLAVTSVVQVDSAATEGLQLVDMLTGAVAFCFKAECGLASPSSRKGQLAEHFLNRLDVTDFNQGFRTRNFNVSVYEHRDWLKRQHIRLSSAHSRV